MSWDISRLLQVEEPTLTPLTVAVEILFFSGHCSLPSQWYCHAWLTQSAFLQEVGPTMVGDEHSDPNLMQFLGATKRNMLGNHL